MRVVVLALAAALLAGACGGESEDTEVTPTATTTQAAPPTVSADEPLDGMGILRRSDVAMADAGYVITESYARDREGRPVEPRVVVQETHGNAVRFLATTHAQAECIGQDARVAPFALRERGALAFYPPREGEPDRGATAPEDVEILREEQYEGKDAWIIRFQYRLPSIEGPYPREHTEWVAKDDFRLLRQEIETYDPFGFVGQEIVRFTEYRQGPAECPRAPQLTPSDLEPVTQPRLEAPSPYR